jgi:hypothetical protein
MTFDEWYYKVENHSMRCERFDADLVAFMDDKVPLTVIEQWLRAAYQVGHDHAVDNLMDDGK